MKSVKFNDPLYRYNIRQKKIIKRFLMWEKERMRRNIRKVSPCRLLVIEVHGSAKILCTQPIYEGIEIFASSKNDFCSEQRLVSIS